MHDNPEQIARRPTTVPRKSGNESVGGKDGPGLDTIGDREFLEGEGISDTTGDTSEGFREDGDVYGAFEGRARGEAGDGIEEVRVEVGSGGELADGEWVGGEVGVDGSEEVSDGREFGVGVGAEGAVWGVEVREAEP